MSMFEAPRWESDELGDSTCALLFQQNLKKNKYSKKDVVDGKIRKIYKTKARVSKPRGKMKNILCEGFNTLQHCKNYTSKIPFARNNGDDSKKFLVSNDNESETVSKQFKKNRKESNITFSGIGNSFTPKKITKTKDKNLKGDNSNANVKKAQNRAITMSQKISSQDLKNIGKEVKSKMKTVKMKNNNELDKSKCKVAPKTSHCAAPKEVAHTMDSTKLNNSKIGLKNQHLKLKLQVMLSKQNAETGSKSKNILTLRERMMAKLKAARFRYLNEQIYSQTGKDAQEFFKIDPKSFKAYHEGYQQQIQKWPLNPVDNIIKSIQKMPMRYVIADLGCGDAKIAKSVNQTVHSFDLVAANELVTTCDMAHLPLTNNSVDVAVFCLSLMGINLQDYLCESNRILKLGGIMKIAEVESRFDNIEDFIEGVQHFGFKVTWKDFSHNLFYFLDFKKISQAKTKKKLPIINLKPCIYKKR